MIGRLAGTLLEKKPPQILVDVHGVGYELDVPMSTFFGLPATGGPVILHTHLAIREDGHFLYGFATLQERAAFRQLLKVSGIGARTALAVLSGLSVADLAQAVALQEASRLVKVPGIGKKTAERLLLELRDKLDPALSPAQGVALAAAPGALPPSTAKSDILNALLALGYNEREALGAIKGLDEAIDVSTGIRQALKHLSKL
ncbi:Holliday junction branch migration protein RuvA [Zoogloeaceae bacteirum Par-f-2]|nr:Holliday junction branch migration protein RuvA [Rhodocyclaceae bacterium]AVZ78264.1 Holliday junction branch migration protein RuvA [Zoogloeaceae bacteirum Par-f-2]